MDLRGHDSRISRSLVGVAGNGIAVRIVTECFYDPFRLANLIFAYLRESAEGESISAVGLASPVAKPAARRGIGLSFGFDGDT